MSCRIERLPSDGVLLRVSARIHAEHVDMLRELVEREEGRVAIDLREVTLVDRDTVEILAGIEANGIELSNCPAYIRVWVAQERDRTGAQ